MGLLVSPFKFLVASSYQKSRTVGGISEMTVEGVNDFYVEQLPVHSCFIIYIYI